MSLSTDIKKRFLKVVNTAITERWNNVSDKKEFAIAAGFDPQNLWNLNQKGRSVTIEMIHCVCKNFQINANYLITGSGQMRISETPDSEKIRKIELILKK